MSSLPLSSSDNSLFATVNQKQHPNMIEWLPLTPEINLENERTYVSYDPWISTHGGHEHPIPLALPYDLLAVTMPTQRGCAPLDPDTVKNGRLSIAQLETVARVRAAWRQRLGDGARAGFLLGDGTGAGKTRSLLALAMIVYRETGEPTIYASAKRELIANLADEWAAMGGEPKALYDLSRHQRGTPLPEGVQIAFTAYSRLRKPEGKDGLVDAVVTPAFKGCIILDESQNLRHAGAENVTKVVEKTDDQPTDPAKPKKVRRRRVLHAGQISAQSAAVLELTRRAPDAHIIYASATAASDLHELRYMERLGLWGPKTIFADYPTLRGAVSKAGILGFELLARKMVTMGRCIVRTISYEGLEYETLVSPILPAEAERIDRYIEFWRTVGVELRATIQQSPVLNKVDDPQAKDIVSRHQATFVRVRNDFMRLATLSLRLRGLIAEGRAALDDGNAVVVQVNRTHEADLKRSIARGDDLNARAAVESYLREHFPTASYTRDGQQIVEEVDPLTQTVVQNAKAVQVRDQLLATARELILDQNPLDTIINALGGTDKVAEATGRTLRSVKNDEGEISIERRTPRMVAEDIESFQTGKKHVLLFSESKAGAGYQFHADPRHDDTRRRVHFLFEVGNRADKTIQAMGRTNRTGQANAPRYVIVFADLPADRLDTDRFALRLDTLGAISRGDRVASNVGFFETSNNLLDRIARDSYYTTSRLLDGHAGNDPASILGKAALRLQEVLGRGAIAGTTLHQLLSSLHHLPIADQQTIFNFHRAAVAQEREERRLLGFDATGKSLRHDGFTVVGQIPYMTADGSYVPKGTIPLDRITVQAINCRYTPKVHAVAWEHALDAFNAAILPENAPRFGYVERYNGQREPYVSIGLQPMTKKLRILTPLGIMIEDPATLAAHNDFAAIERAWKAITAHGGHAEIPLWLFTGELLQLPQMKRSPKMIVTRTNAKQRLMAATFTPSVTKAMLERINLRTDDDVVADGDTGSDSE